MFAGRFAGLDVNMDQTPRYEVWSIKILLDSIFRLHRTVYITFKAGDVGRYPHPAPPLSLLHPPLAYRCRRPQSTVSLAGKSELPAAPWCLKVARVGVGAARLGVAEAQTVEVVA
jgi:hypothetical protein